MAICGVIRYQTTRIRRQEFNPWDRDEDYGAVVMSETRNYDIVEQSDNWVYQVSTEIP